MLDSDFFQNLLSDIKLAELSGLPGPAKQNYAIALQVGRTAKSAPPPWVWLLIELCKAVIPLIIDWLNKKYGSDWISIPPTGK